tara:strand:- start:46 stop:390 length:345 start_codon:yes stop_codon:yes gene_type:complete
MVDLVLLIIQETEVDQVVAELDFQQLLDLMVYRVVLLGFMLVVEVVELIIQIQTLEELILEDLVELVVAELVELETTHQEQVLMEQQIPEEVVVHQEDRVVLLLQKQEDLVDQE